MSDLLNVCEEIKCPFSNPKTGCVWYGVSGQCHLIHPGNDIHRDEYLTDNQYWIFANPADSRVDINQLREENIAKITNSESMQRRVKSFPRNAIL